MWCINDVNLLILAVNLCCSRILNLHKPLSMYVVLPLLSAHRLLDIIDLVFLFSTNKDFYHISCVSLCCSFNFIAFSSFLCQLTCQSADIMSSLCGVGVRVRVNNFFSQTTRPRDMLFFLKDTLSIEDEKLFMHANLSVRLFARDITRGVPPPKV